MQRSGENSGKTGANGPRSSLAFNLALARLSQIIDRQNAALLGEAAASEVRAAAAAQAAVVRTLPDGNHGETSVEVTNP